MSILGKRWLIKNTNAKKTAFEKILENRGFDQIKELTEFHDPYLFTDMEKAVARINKAISNKEKIVVFGDYDVDGISSTAIVVHILKKLKANIHYRLPNRSEDGYGLSEKFIDEFIKEKVNLVITVDCGISCKNEIDKAASNGIDVIITDHHTIPESFPDKAFTILHPKLKGSAYPFPDLTGSGIAFKLAHALIIHHFPRTEVKEHLYKLVDLAALGTVADLGPLLDENRFIVKKGLEYLAKTKWVGLKKILSLAEISEDDELSCHTIGFQIAPRLNAAGRIGDPYIALNLLLQDCENENVHILGEKLESLNKQRQEMTFKAIEEIEEEIFANGILPNIFITENQNWHVGILGLVAGRLVETYGRPAVIMQDLGDTLVGSARSPEYFNIVEAITSLGEHLITFGGHAQAAGFNLKKENLEAFKKAFFEYADNKLKNTELTPILRIDCELGNEDIKYDLIDKIEELRPFGVANEKPIFIMRNLEPYYVDQVGKKGDHLKFTVKSNDQLIPVIAFRMGQFADDVRKHKSINVAFNLEKNTFNNKTSIQLKALDIELS